MDRGLAGDLAAVAELADSFTRLVDYAPFAIVSCLDGAAPDGRTTTGRKPPGPSALDRRASGEILANELLPCAFWPEATLESVVVDAAGAPPILVVGSTGDAATPYETAVSAAERLDSGALLTVELDGHVAIGDSDCADAAITRYLVDLTVPDDGHPLLTPTWKSAGPHPYCRPDPTEPRGEARHGVQPRRPARRGGRRHRRPRVHRLARPAPHLRRRGRRAPTGWPTT